VLRQGARHRPPPRRLLAASFKRGLQIKKKEIKTAASFGCSCSETRKS
jgi:hypothetical protein